LKEINKKGTINFIDTPKSRYDFEVERRFGSSKKLQQHTNFKPDTDLESGINKICELLT